MSKNETYLMLGLIAWVAYTAGRSRGLTLAAASQPTYPGGLDWLNSWYAN